MDYPNNATSVARHDLDDPTSSLPQEPRPDSYTFTAGQPLRMVQPDQSRSSKALTSSNRPAVAGKKSNVESGSSESNTDRSNLTAAHPSPPIPIRSNRSRHSRSHSIVSDTGSEVLIFGEPQPSPTDSWTLRYRSGFGKESTAYSSLPEPALNTQASLSEIQSRRLSSNSIYSLASARGIINSSPSAHGSETGTAPRSVSVSGIMSSNKGSAAATPPETGLSNVTVTTSSGNALNANGQHHLGPRDPHSQPLDLMRRSQRADSNMRAQPDRSRSRAKRRFSGSTATSTQSQSSDRGAQRDKEESKPAPWGTIGICALDIKARSKPSRNILNRLIANRDFDVVVFGDKVILDEGSFYLSCDFVFARHG